MVPYCTIYLRYRNVMPPPYGVTDLPHRTFWDKTEGLLVVWVGSVFSTKELMIIERVDYS